MSQLKKNFIYSSIISISGLVSPLIIFPYITRTLGPNNYGLVSFANSFIQYFIVIATVGVPFYGIREIAKNKNNIINRTKIFTEIVIIHIALSLIAILFYLLSIFYFTRCRENLDFFFWGILMIATFPLNIYWFFSGLEEFKYIAIRTVSLQVLQIIAIFFLVKSSNDSLIFFLIPIAISIITTIINIRYGLKFLVFSFLWKELEYKKHFKPLFYIFLFTIATSMYELLDTVILGFLSNNESVSFYTVANRINKIPITLVSILSPVLIPRMSFAAGQNDKIEMTRLINKSISFVLLFSIPIIFGIYILAPEIVIVLSGTQFEPSIATIRLLSPATLILGLSTIFMLQILIPLSKDKYVLTSVFIGTIISLTLNFLLIPIINQNGAAIANIIAELTVLIISFLCAKQFIDIKFNFKQLFFTISSSIPFFLIVYSIRYFFKSDILILGLSISISAISYFIIQIYLFKEEISTEMIRIVIARMKSILR